MGEKRRGPEGGSIYRATVGKGSTRSRGSGATSTARTGKGQNQADESPCGSGRGLVFDCGTSPLASTRRFGSTSSIKEAAGPHLKRHVELTRLHIVPGSAAPSLEPS